MRIRNLRDVIETEQCGKCGTFHAYGETCYCRQLPVARRASEALMLPEVKFVSQEPLSEFVELGGEG